MEDLYKILKVARNASSEDIKNAYVKIRKEAGANPQGEELVRVQEVGHAWDILSNADKRAKYDREFVTQAKQPEGTKTTPASEDIYKDPKYVSPEMEDKFKMQYGPNYKDLFGDLYNWSSGNKTPHKEAPKRPSTVETPRSQPSTPTMPKRRDFEEMEKLFESMQSKPNPISESLKNQGIKHFSDLKKKPQTPDWKKILGTKENKG